MFNRILKHLLGNSAMDDAIEQPKENTNATGTENAAEKTTQENQTVDDAAKNSGVPVSSGTIDDCTCNTNDQMPGSWHAIFCPNYRAEETELVQHPNVEQVSETDFVVKEPTEENKA